MKIYNLNFNDAKEILDRLYNEFNLVYTAHKKAVIGSFINASICKQDNDRYYVDIQSSFFVDSTILEAIPEYNNDYFLIKK